MTVTTDAFANTIGPWPTSSFLYDFCCHQISLLTAFRSALPQECFGRILWTDQLCNSSCCIGFVQPYVWFLLLIRVLIGSHVSSIKVLLVRFTRERFTIFKPTVRLKDRRADVPRGQRLFAFSVYTANYYVLTTTSIGRNYLEEKTNANSTSRHLLPKVNRRVPVLFRKVDSNWSAVDISTCLRLSEWQICIFWPLTIIFSTLRVSTFISLAHDTVQ